MAKSNWSAAVKAVKDKVAYEKESYRLAGEDLNRQLGRDKPKGGKS